MIRPGAGVTAMALALGVATAVLIRHTATEALVAVTPLVVSGVVLLSLFVLVGSTRWVGVASAPMVGAVMLEAGFADEPSWIRSIVLGCLWYLAMECAWEAIDRRDGARHSRPATLHRLREVVGVVALALTLGLVAAAATTVAPLRSVFLQALAVGALLATFVLLLRTAVRPTTE